MKIGVWKPPPIDMVAYAEGEKVGLASATMAELMKNPYSRETEPEKHSAWSLGWCGGYASTP